MKSSCAKILVVCFICVGCGGSRREHLTPQQEALRDRIALAGTFSHFCTQSDTVTLSIPDSVDVDLLPIVLVAPHGLILCNPMAKNIVEVNRSGSFIRTFGKPGAGPGEFRDITAATIDRDYSVYVFDHTRARVTRFHRDGTYALEVPVLNPDPIRHLCVNTGGILFYHHTPDSLRPGFVSCVDSTNIPRAMVRSPGGYGGYYFRGYMEGGIVAGKIGEVYETNAYSPTIHRIGAAYDVTEFGSDLEGFQRLPPSERVSTAAQLNAALRHSTMVRHLGLMRNGTLVVQEILQYSEGGTGGYRKLIVYDTSGTRLGDLRSDIGDFFEGDGDVLIEVVPPDIINATENPDIRLPKFVLWHVAEGKDG